MNGSTLTSLEALDELTDEELGRFVFFLFRSPPEGFQKIPKAKVQNKTRETVADEMIEIYGEKDALEVTIEILKIMKRNHLANDIQERMQQKRLKPDPNAVSSKKQRLADSPSKTGQPGQELQSVISKLKTCLKEENNFIVEETAKDKNKIPLNKIYTDLIITKGESRTHNNEHEVLTSENSHCPYETSINFSDIFSRNEEGIRTVLTKGDAGIGKTVSVQKFIIDWAENKTNQDLIFMFVLPFRKLNLIKHVDYSLHELLILLHPQLKGCHSDLYVDKKVLFIFDGLEESRIQMNFNQTFIISDADTKSTVEALIINLITKALLPSALIWITSRPAAANQIPSQYIDCVTEIQGFNDSQKEQYFRKRVTDKDKANRIISHIRAARSLHIMCQIPIFCWISVTALQPWLTRKCKGESPTTLTEMYSHFLLVQINRKNEKFDKKHENNSMTLLESNKNMILKLAELAFKQLRKGNVLFYEEDLKMCGIDIEESFLHSGLCTEIFKMESEFYRIKTYCFVHLSFQEFFAALYVFHCYLCKNMEEIMFLPNTKEITLDVLMKHAVNEALKSKNGHLDLFLRFLHGMCLESNQRLLHGLLPHTMSSSESIEKIKQNLKRGQKRNINPERWLNLTQCLIEMKDYTLQQEIKTYLESKIKSKKLTLAQCSAMANMFQVSEEVIEELNLKKYNKTEEGCRRLIPALRNCKKAILANCNLTETSCENISSALQSANSPLRELDLSNNDLQDAGLKLIYKGLKCKLEILSVSNCNLTTVSCEDIAAALRLRTSSLKTLDLSYNDLQKGINQLFTGLKSPNCTLDTLRLSNCNVTVESCNYIAKALSPLRELDLSHNDLRDTGMKLLCDGLKSSCCNLNILKVSDCKLTEQSSPDVALLLSKENSSLRELDLSDNDIKDSGVKALSNGLSSSECVLEILRLSGCGLTKRTCYSLISALHLNSKHLIELDLDYNHLGPSERKQLSKIRKFFVYTLKTFSMNHNEKLRTNPGLKKYAFKLTLDPNTANTQLSLTGDNTRISVRSEHQQSQDHMGYQMQVLSKESLFGRCYWEVEWHRKASIAVAYKSFIKRGCKNNYVFGCSKKSWSLELSENDNRCAVVHNNKSISKSHPQGNRVGVFVDCSRGILSFYDICSDTQTLPIHTFRTNFRETLVAGFGLGHDEEASVSLIHS
ncbi:NACHT, LRR and PYD domains-containing protein 12 isoform X6 [Silurus asotus]|uniref:NACHT, LRR and PYD domains-containing protein 12 isoform X6 n=1 Tax=Silurus asotus TaxID=30991 RepID=A0AAD5AXQ2_SILAS|nr:NACHT, LRR and PYD domains-containing protein 12 isoform X6 [Silurus asotus]